MDKVSALMDGELDVRQAHEQFARLRQHSDLAEGWNIYHIIGDSLRGDSSLSPGFGRKMAERLSVEPTILAPQRSATKRVTAYALSAAASVAAIAMVGWVAFLSNPLAPQQELARAPASPAPAAVTAAPPATQLASVPSDGGMNDYLIAHQEFSPSTSIQGVAPYIRTVSSYEDKGK